MSDVIFEETIDEAWIAGIRKGLKKILKQTAEFDGRMERSTEIDPELIDRAERGAVESLENLLRYVRRLRQDLLFNKGMWDLPSEAGRKEANILKRRRTKVIEELESAEEAVENGITSVRYTAEETREKNRLGHPGLAYDSIYSEGNLDSFNRHLGAFGYHVDEVVDKVDSAISGKLLRHLTKLVKDSFVYRRDGKWHRKVKMPLDMGEIPPDVVHVGRANLIFKDIPPNAKGETPRRVGSETDNEEKLSGMAKDWGYLNPRSRKNFVDAMVNAKSRLRSARLEDLFRGNVVVMPTKQGGVNQHGADLGVAGRYYRKGDEIRIYGDYRTSFIEEIIIHEIGHRYWYKHMTSQDRENFSKWFGDVPAVSSYGGMASAEDFAETFLYYVTKRKMTKAQKESQVAEALDNSCSRAAFEENIRAEIKAGKDR